MVKSPKIRHSKQRDEPVTIDLSAEDVKRGDQKTGKDDTAQAAPKAASSDQAKASASATKSAATDSGTAKSGAANKQTSSDSDKGKSAAAGAGSSFGRDSSGKAQPKSHGTPKESGASPKAAEPNRGGAFGALAAGLIGGVVALAGAGALYVGGYLPAPSALPPSTDNTAIERLETELTSLREEIAALKSVPQPGDTGALNTALEETNTRVESMAVLVEEMRTDLGRLSDAVAAGGGGDNTGLAELQTRLAEIEQVVANLPKAGNGDTDAISAELTSVSEQVASLGTALDNLTAGMQQKFAEIDSSLASLGERLEEQANEPGVALAIAASALKAAIDRGQPFANELETFARLAPDAPEIDALRGYAATGVPTAAAIAGETDVVAQRIIAATRPDNANAGLLDRLWASAESLITVRPIGAVEGEDVPAIVARMEAAINNGDYGAAVAEYETLPDDAKAAGADFITKVKARQAADELVSKVLAAALRA